ncbi:hypothetical protein [Tuwongella immobilis]|uniref:Uncharacterized protein n=1 Tax=Tuwongella immobilis TaxID=692036 RepID=A0A6C2YM04_9BACT|nr:hypothetical protein [Tuwongella immobilis]VIP01952.1 unnamed protein product [Tuwongella immobilis]VTR99943.1 unnamed protein product [Tuwongella immobilis]
MKSLSPWLGVVFGLGMGLGLAAWHSYSTPKLIAANNDRYGDYVLVTGAASINPVEPMDAIWMLDYRSAKLLASIVDKNTGKVVGWAEADLMAEFGLAPRDQVHFLMTTGNIALGQSALYIAEVTTGKFGVYTLGANPNGQGLLIRRHDLSSFRAKAIRPGAGIPQPQINVPPANPALPNGAPNPVGAPVPVIPVQPKAIPGPMTK